MRTAAGDAIADWMTELADNPNVPPSVRATAWEKLCACAKRKPWQTVQDVIGTRH